MSLNITSMSSGSNVATRVVDAAYAQMAASSAAISSGETTTKSLASDSVDISPTALKMFRASMAEQKMIGDFVTQSLENI